MAEVDTSSYPKANAPKSLIEQVQGFNALESGALTVEKQKLDLVNQRYGYLIRELNSLPANATAEDMVNLGQKAVNMKLIDPKMYATFVSDIPKDPAKVDGYRKQIATKLLDTQQAINQHYGVNENVSQGNQTAIGVRQSPIQGGQFKQTGTFYQQLPPSTETVSTDPNSYGQRQLIGPAGPAGVQSAPISSQTGPIVNDPSQGNLTGSPVSQEQPRLRNMTTGPTGPTIRRRDLEEPTFDNRFSAAFPNAVTSLAPGEAEAVQAVGAQSGKDYAASLMRARNYQADLYPAEAALKAISELGPQAIGPGTDALNDIKRVIVTWLPNVDPKTIENVSNFDQAKKYLTQVARTSGNTGTNDQLAAAFDANPNTKMSTAGVETVLKSIIALRRMEHAQTLLFAEQGLRPSQFSQWVSKNQNVFDPRAFGFVDMDRKAQENLIKKLTPAQKKKFEYSLEFAEKAGLIEPPQLR